jgi:hypothetical protein
MIASTKNRLRQVLIVIIAFNSRIPLRDNDDNHELRRALLAARLI